MNRGILLLMTLILFSNCSHKKEQESLMTIDVNINDEINSKKFIEQGRVGKFYKVDIDLFNNSDSALYFWAMTCSWEYNWTSSNESVQLCNEGCDSNYPKLRQIESKQKITFNGILQVLDSNIIFKNEKLKLGFTLINKDDLVNISDFLKVLTEKKKHETEIIWSNEFSFKKE